VSMTWRQTHARPCSEDPRRDGSCGAGLVHVCIDEPSAAAAAGAASALGAFPARRPVARMGEDAATVAAEDVDGTAKYI